MISESLLTTNSHEMELETQIRKYLAENVLYVDDTFTYDNDASFIAHGLIDSTGVMELVMYVQSTFAITVDPHEITPKNFDAVNKLVSFIRRKQSARAQSGD